MSFNYARIAATAATLLDSFGRSITVQALDRAVSDSAMPWRGKDNPRATPLWTATVPAAFVDPNGAGSLGFTFTETDETKRATTVCIIAANATTADIENADEVKDSDGSLWHVTDVQKLKPGSTTLLWGLGLRR